MKYTYLVICPKFAMHEECETLIQAEEVLNEYRDMSARPEELYIYGCKNNYIRRLTFDETTGYINWE